MYRCLELARLGAGTVAPNPMVGAVLVHDGKIIGEGFHQKYGETHAEVNCIGQANLNGHGELISQSTLYVSLEPCSHFGKTPPCTDLIIKNKIPKVFIGCRDPFKEVEARLNDAVGPGRGVEKLRSAGVEVVTGVLEEESKELNKRFITFHTLHRPFIVLKWAQTADGFIASLSHEPASKRLFISNEYSNRLVHKWRSEEASILVGTNTAMTDDPELTTRLWPGNSPVRLVVDMEMRLPSSLKIFNKQHPTIIFNAKIHSEESEKDGIRYYQVTGDVSLVHQIINALYQLKIQSVIVEGGARLLQSFIDEGMWDEARIVTNSELRIKSGLHAPQLHDTLKIDEQIILSDKIEIFKPE